MDKLVEFWDFYIGLYSNENFVIRIAAFTATLAAITFLLNFILRPIWKLIKNYFAKISAILGISHQMVQTAFGTGFQAPLLTVTITNKDRIPKYIQNPSIKTSRRINGENLFIVPKQSGTYPLKLEQGQQITLEFDTVNLNNQILKHLSQRDKICLIVTDTTGKKYYTNKFTMKHIVGHINMAAKMNKK